MRVSFLLNLVLIILVSSCANFVNKMHKQIAYQERSERNKQFSPQANAPYNPFKRKNFDKRPIENPVTYSSQSPRQQDRPPRVKRDYRRAKKRITANDLVDTGNDGSLWAGQDKDSFLFAENKSKSLGDIIIIDVLEDFRNDIANELKRVFPARKKKVAKKEGENKKEGEEAATTPEPAATAANSKTGEGEEAKIYDKISGQVTEIISKDYLMVRGQKEVLFRKRKHIVDIQALVSKRDLVNNDTLPSDKILEKRILVVR
jgi:flagellar L-ring protein precursor FlgH